jgi:serine/threonine protein kinase
VIGRTLSSYRVVEKLGEGGMGAVYLARDERLGRDVALKVLPAVKLGDEAAQARFRKEAKALLRLSHPHVATLLDFGSERDRPPSWRG